MKRSICLSVCALVLPVVGAAQGASKGSAPEILPTAVQIASAISPLPEQFKESATVLGYQGDAKVLVPLRQNDGTYICLADDPKETDRYHVACYHKDLEPFMLRGRQLRAEGVVNVDSARFAEIKSGKLNMPNHPSALYSLTGKGVDASTGLIPGAVQLYVVYIPNATGESTGLPTKPGPGPWIMFPGTPKAHIMFTLRM